jgi:hypothetical protein
MTTVRSDPGWGETTARVSNARSSPSLRIGVGQIVGRTFWRTEWFCVTTAWKV